MTLFLVSALCQVDRLLPYVLAESMKRDLGLSDTELGLVTGIAFAVCCSLMSLPLTRAADRGEPRLVLVLCILAWSTMTSLGGLATGFLFLALTRFGVALGESGATPSGHALIAREIAPQRRGQALGFFSMGMPLGTMAGFGIGGVINDTFGWRTTLFGAGAIGLFLAVLVLAVTRPTSPVNRVGINAGPFIQSALLLLSSPVFLWLFIGANIVGFAAAPFYAFSIPFLIRTHGLTASEAGTSFGLLQGVIGGIGTLIGGRGFDKAVQVGHGQLLKAPAVAFLVATVSTTAALFVPAGWMSIVLFIPGMFSFSFLLPWAFGSAHLVAGPGKQALASSLIMIGSGLLGPALGPLIVGMVSDAAAAAQIPDGLRWGMLFVPLASFLSGLAMLAVNRRIAAAHSSGIASVPSRNT